jgi:hypothetical protein
MEANLEDTLEEFEGVFFRGMKLLNNDNIKKLIVAILLVH